MKNNINTVFLLRFEKVKLCFNFNNNRHAKNILSEIMYRCIFGMPVVDLRIINLKFNFKKLKEAAKCLKYIFQYFSILNINFYNNFLYQ